MAANHKTAHFDNVRERRAARLAKELDKKPAKKKAKKSDDS